MTTQEGFLHHEDHEELEGVEDEGFTIYFMSFIIQPVRNLFFSKKSVSRRGAEDAETLCDLRASARGPFWLWPKATLGSSW